MNIFVLDESPINSAIWQHDRHVVKMILETAQMLSTAIHENPKLALYFPDSHRPLLYKVTHKNHPAAKWVRESHYNFFWATAHLNALMGEYSRRFMRQHKTYDLMMGFNKVCTHILQSGNFWQRDEGRNLVMNPGVLKFASHHTPFVYCGPDQFANASVIESYRAYYTATKMQGNRWTNRRDQLRLPDWLLACLPVIHVPDMRPDMTGATYKRTRPIPVYATTTTRAPLRFGVKS